MGLSDASDQPLALETMQSLAHGLLPEVQQFAELVTQGVLEHVPELAPPMFDDAIDAIVESSGQIIGGMLSTLAYGFSPRTAEPPIRTRQVYERLIESGGDIHTLMRAYRIGHRIIWQRWTAHVCENVTDPDLRLAILNVTSTHIFEYLDITSEQHVVDDRARRHRPHRSVSREELVMRLLDTGEEPSTVQLGYELRSHHVAVVAAPIDGDARPRRSLDAILARADGPRLIIPAGDGGWWAWVGAADRAQLDVLADDMTRAAPAGVLAGIGDPGYGADGFRSSHAEAMEAVRTMRHAPHSEPRVVRHRDIEYASLLATNPDRARRFARRQLQDLAADDESTAMLRDTVRALFANSNAAAAARQLGVHHKTIAYRIRQAERLMGRPIGPNRRDIEAALLIHATIWSDDNPARMDPPAGRNRHE